MATKITKWTREKGSRNKDFVDPTRRSHKAYKVYIDSQDASRMKDLSRVKVSDKVEERLEGKEDLVARKRIERLRAQLHAFNLTQEDQKPPSPKSEAELIEKTPKELRKEATRRMEIIQRARKYIPPPILPVTPKERSQTIHVKVLKERAAQIRERAEQVRAHHEEERYWADRVAANHLQHLDDVYLDKLMEIERKAQVKKDLDKLCKERDAKLAKERAEKVALRRDVEESDAVHVIYQEHLRTQKAQQKANARESALRQLEDVKNVKLQKALEEEQLREHDLRYSVAKRAYARKVKKRILDRMKGKRTPVAELYLKSLKTKNSSTQV